MFSTSAVGTAAVSVFLGFTCVPIITVPYCLLLFPLLFAIRASAALTVDAIFIALRVVVTAIPVSVSAVFLLCFRYVSAMFRLLATVA